MKKIETPLADEMRANLCHLAKNLEEAAKGTIGDYTINSSRSMLLTLFGLTTDVEINECLVANRKESAPRTPNGDASERLNDRPSQN